MKKTVYCIFVFLLTISFLVVSVPGSVSAAAGDIGSGTWVTPGSTAAFTTVNVDKAAASAPDYLQQLSEGIVLSAPAKICYPFRGGQFHWVPRIMRLTNAKWTAMTTEKESIFTDEAVEYACTKAPAAGTYALFGYYDGPAEVANAGGLPKCDGVEMNGYYYNTTHDGNLVVGISLNTYPAELASEALSYNVLSYTPTTVSLSPMTGNFTFRDFMPDFHTELIRAGGTISGHLKIRVFTPSCYVDLDLKEAS
jgi:hypothetical protein